MCLASCSHLAALGSVLILSLYCTLTLSCSSATSCNAWQNRAVRFRKYLHIAKHVPVCNYTHCEESYLKCIIGSFAAHLLHTAQTHLSYKSLYFWVFFNDDFTFGRTRSAVPLPFHRLLPLSVCLGRVQLWSIRDLSRFCCICAQSAWVGFSPHKKTCATINRAVRVYSSLVWVWVLFVLCHPPLLPLLYALQLLNGWRLRLVWAATHLSVYAYSFQVTSWVKRVCDVDVGRRSDWGLQKREAMS